MGVKDGKREGGLLMMGIILEMNGKWYVRK